MHPVEHLLDAEDWKTPSTSSTQSPRQIAQNTHQVQLMQPSTANPTWTSSEMESDSSYSEEFLGRHSVASDTSDHQSCPPCRVHLHNGSVDARHSNKHGKRPMPLPGIETLRKRESTAFVFPTPMLMGLPQAIQNGMPSHSNSLRSPPSFLSRRPSLMTLGPHGSTTYSPISIQTSPIGFFPQSASQEPNHQLENWKTEVDKHQERIVQRTLGEIMTAARKPSGDEGDRISKQQAEDDIDDDDEELETMAMEEIKIKFKEVKQHCRHLMNQNRELKTENASLKESERNSCDLIMRGRHMVLKAYDEKAAMKIQLKKSEKGNVIYPNNHASWPTTFPHQQQLPTTSSAPFPPFRPYFPPMIKQEVIETEIPVLTDVDYQEVLFDKAVIGGTVVRNVRGREREIRPAQRIIPATFEEGQTIWMARFSDNILPGFDISPYLFNPQDLWRRVPQLVIRLVNPYHFYRRQMPKKEGNITWEKLTNQVQKEWKTMWKPLVDCQKEQWWAGLIEYKKKDDSEAKRKKRNDKKE